MTIVKEGPYGAHCQTSCWFQLNRCERIVEVIISCGYVVNGIGFVIANSCGRTTTKWYGGRGGTCYRVKLGCNEYITKISGSYGTYSYCNGCVIASLKIHTNCRPCGYGPYGQGKCCYNVCHFQSQVHPCGSIVGFHGRFGQYLESIGLWVRRGCH